MTPSPRLVLEPYRVQTARWPARGRHILAQYDASSVVVYQAYAPGVGRFAAGHGCFGGPFSFDRMSWIKPSFLWMMHRSGWGTKAGQEVVLAVWLRREGFDEILRQAVPSSFDAALFTGREAWQRAVRGSSVRLQWDPDHHPSGAKLERRAIQLGLRGEVLARYAREWIVAIEDISAFVAEQRQHILAGQPERLLTPREEIYPVRDAELARRLGLSREMAIPD